MIADLIFTHLRRPGMPAITLTPAQHEAIRVFTQRNADGVYQYEPSACLCGAEDGLLIARRDRYGLAVNTYFCSRCGMLWTSPRLDPPSLTTFYAEDYRPIYVGDTQSPDTFFAEQVRHGEQVLEFLRPFIVGNTRNVVFDIGCGSGGMLLPFQRADWHGYGCDLGESYLNRGRSEGLHLVHGNASVLAPFAPARLILISHVLEHLSDPLHTLIELSKLLDDDGYLYIELPGVFVIHRTYGKLIRFLQNAHLYHFTLDGLCALLARAGFVLVHGDERIWALFQRRPLASYSTPINHARRVLRYLYMVELANRAMIWPVYNRMYRTVCAMWRRTI